MQFLILHAAFLFQDNSASKSTDQVKQPNQAPSSKIMSEFTFEPALQAWQDYRKKMEMISGSWRAKSSNSNGNQYDQKSSIKLNYPKRVLMGEYHVEAGSSKAESRVRAAPLVAGKKEIEEKTDPSQPSVVPICTIVNERYTAFLFQHEGKWTVGDVHRVGADRPRQPGDFFAYATYQRAYWEPLIYPHFAWSLPDLVNDISFKIVETTAYRAGQDELIRIRFTSRTRRDVDRNNQLITGGTIVLDPKRSWCLRSAQIESDSGDGRTYSFTSSWQCQPTGQTIPLPLQVRSDTITRENGKEVMTSSSTIDYQLRFLTEPPLDEEFTLSAFGLPEPTQEQLQREILGPAGPGTARVAPATPQPVSSTWIWFTSLGLLFVIVLLFLNHWRLTRLKRTITWEVKPS